MQKKAMKSVVGMAVGLLLCIGSISIYLHDHEKNESKTSPSSTDSTITSSISKTSDTASREENSEPSYDTFLSDFGDKFLNYASIDQRNHQVKELFTKEARAVNGLDTLVHLNIKGSGEVQAIYRQTKDKMSYVIVGSEETNNNKNIVVLFVELTTEGTTTKIKKLTVSYVRQAY